MYTFEANLTPKGYEQIADVSTPAKTLTVPTGATYAKIQAVTKAVRYRDDGTDPTAAIGIQIAAGDSIWYIGDLSALAFFEEEASAELNVSYYGAK
jgi:hypothetical protein